ISRHDEYRNKSIISQEVTLTTMLSQYFRNSRKLRSTKLIMQLALEDPPTRPILKAQLKNASAP
ncbi:hypothetical protein WUBG_12389, partial [Wuchereria bancrofti]